MKMERIGQNKIRIFLTFDDLQERGIQKDDMWRELPKVHELFSDMMEQAYNELGFEASGPLAVEVFALPAQGMVVIVTKSSMHIDSEHFFDDDLEEDSFEMEVMLEQSDTIIYAFQDFEDLLRLAKTIRIHIDEVGVLFFYKERWILQIEPDQLEEEQYETVISILSEFGEASSISPYVLEEYGKKIIDNNAIKQLCEHFH